MRFSDLRAADADAAFDRQYEADELLAASLVGDVVFYDGGAIAVRDGQVTTVETRGIVDEVEPALGGVYVSGRELDADGKPVDGDTWEALVGDVRVDEDLLAVEAHRMLAFLLGRFFSMVGDGAERPRRRFVNVAGMKPDERSAFEAGLAAGPETGR